MKRLFLASSGLGALKDFVGVDPKTVKMVFIPTAGNLDDDVWWIDKDRDVLKRMGFQIKELDIASTSVDAQKAALTKVSIVYVAGGNTFYLLKQMQDSGFDQLLTNYVNNGGMYAGASAGALIAGADINPVATIDEPEKAQGLKSTEGLKFVDIVPIPHYSMSERKNPIDAIKKKYDPKFEIVLLTDDQAIVVEGDNWQVVPSERSQLEHDWFTRAHITD